METQPLNFLTLTQAELDRLSLSPTVLFYGHYRGLPLIGLKLSNRLRFCTYVARIYFDNVEWNKRLLPTASVLETTSKYYVMHWDYPIFPEGLLKSFISLTNELAQLPCTQNEHEVLAQYSTLFRRGRALVQLALPRAYQTPQMEKTDIAQILSTLSPTVIA